MVVCEACGTENPPGATFCSKCARKLDPETQAAIKVQRESHTATGIRWTMVIGTTILVIIVLAVLVVLAVHGL